MARKKKEEIVTVYDVDFPESARAGRAIQPSPYQELFEQSYGAGQAKGLPYDGTEEQFKAIARDLERAKRHAGLGMRGPVPSTLEDGTHVAVFLATEKRVYNRSNGNEEAPAEVSEN